MAAIFSQSQSDAAQMNNRRRKVQLLAASAGVVVIVAAMFWYADYLSNGRYRQTTNNAYIQADTVMIATKVSGFVDKVFVLDNQDVAVGQPLMQIESGDYRAQAAQYTAQVALAKAGADGAVSAKREQQAVIAEAGAQLIAAEDAAKFSDSEVSRFQPLAATGAESQQRLAQLRQAAREANSNLLRQRAVVLRAQQHLDSLDAQRRQAAAQGQVAEAQLTTARHDLEYTLIRASIAGRIGAKSIRPGQFVQPGVRLTSIVPLDKIYIEANFKETQLGLMRVGQPVTVRVDALPSVELQGQVASLSPGTGSQFSVLPPQNATGNFTKVVQRVPVRISLRAGPEARRLLVPGMSATVTVDTKSAQDANVRIQREQRAFE